jgi:hypothetical protein
LSKEIEQLTGAECTALLRRVGVHWLETSGVEAFVAYQAVHSRLKPDAVKALGWLDGSAKKPPKKLADTSRVALQTILDGEDRDLAKFLEKEIDDLKTAKGQIFDPVTLSILGGTLVACILAARVKKIGSVTFYKDIPPELAKVIKAAGGALGSPGKSEGDD